MKLRGHCLGCRRGSPTCHIKRCAKRYGSACEQFLCATYNNASAVDPIITSRNRTIDFDQRNREGEVVFYEQRGERVAIYEDLLAHYNDGCNKGYVQITCNL